MKRPYQLRLRSSRIEKTAVGKGKWMAHIMESPLFVLATSMAYLIRADTRTTYEEKAQLIAALGKHVSNGDLNQTELQAVVSDAFDYADDIDPDVFLNTVGITLTPGQRTAVVINLYDVMLVDGSVAVGEKSLLQKFVNSFDIGRETMRVIREVTMIKNDTTIFTDRNHPLNEPSYRLDLQMYGWDESDK